MGGILFIKGNCFASKFELVLIDSLCTNHVYYVITCTTLFYTPLYTVLQIIGHLFGYHLVPLIFCFSKIT